MLQATLVRLDVQPALTGCTMIPAHKCHKCHKFSRVKPVWTIFPSQALKLVGIGRKTLEVLVFGSCWGKHTQVVRSTRALKLQVCVAAAAAASALAPAGFMGARSPEC